MGRCSSSSTIPTGEASIFYSPSEPISVYPYILGWLGLVQHNGGGDFQKMHQNAIQYCRYLGNVTLSTVSIPQRDRVYLFVCVPHLHLQPRRSPIASRLSGTRCA